MNKMALSRLQGSDDLLFDIPRAALHLLWAIIFPVEP